ncbi:Ig-like domain-containing protein [Cohnella soli]|uniref:Ig-like domain-containing protein n=1 Tax=Cohnella soli TaxID=425005 RepID=A0ABW0HYL7_9BACL
MRQWEDWIDETHPQPDATDVPESTLVSIAFRKEMNRLTLNTRNILVLDGNNGGRLISDRFLYRYEAAQRKLLIYRKEDSEALGPRNTIEIILTSRIADSQNEKMSIPFHLRFTTR